MESQELSWRGIVALGLAVVMSGLPSSAVAARRDRTPPRIVHVKVLQTPKGVDVQIRARFEDKSEIFAPSVYYRQHGGEKYETVEMTKGEEGYVGVIPAAVASEPLEYFIEVFDAEGNGPAREGSPDKPIPIAVYEDKGPAPPPVADLPPPGPPPPPPPQLVVTDPIEQDDDDGIAGQWWFWTGVGVLVTGGIVATVLLTRSSGPVDSVSVEVAGPDPTRGL